VTLTRVRIPSPSYSSRSGAAVRLIVLHTSEGAQSYQSLGSWFANPANEVSSHVGIDSTPDVIGEYVPRSGCAWTAAGANSVAVQAELCTPSGAAQGWDEATWRAHPQMLANTAAWIAEEAAAFDIPIVKLSPAQAQAGGRGVCQHADLGAWGGGHTDCGPAFPIDQVLAMAAGAALPTPTETEGRTMIAATPTGKGYFTATYDGAVYAFGDAVYRGNAMADISGQVIGIACSAPDGYWLLADDGGVFSFGSAAFYGRPDRV